MQGHVRSRWQSFCYFIVVLFCHTHKICILNLKNDEAREPKEANKACV